MTPSPERQVSRPSPAAAVVVTFTILAAAVRLRRQLSQVHLADFLLFLAAATTAAGLAILWPRSHSGNDTQQQQQAGRAQQQQQQHEHCNSRTHMSGAAGRDQCVVITVVWISVTCISSAVLPS
jgi:hypothetical protein